MSTLFGTGELLFSDDVFTNWDGDTLAKLERPRQTWRSMFTRGGALRIVHADGSTLCELPDVEGEDVDEVRITPLYDAPSALVKKKRRLSPLKLEFTVQDDTGAPMGALKTSPAWHSLDAEDPSGTPIANARLNGHSWTLDLQPNATRAWQLVMLALVVIADEKQGELSGTG
jgi:hypothetical protein